MNADGMEILRKYKDDLSALPAAKAHVEHLVTAPINENQRAALESFVICQGWQALKSSNLIKFVNYIEDYSEEAVFAAADEFYNPIYATKNGKLNRKLESRRELESKLFLKPIIVGGKK